ACNDGVQDLLAADGVAGDHGDHRLGQPADLDLQVEDVEAADAVFVDVAVLAPDALVAAGGEGLGALPGEAHHAHAGVGAGPLERVGQLVQGLGPERVAHLGPADGQLGDALGGLVADIGVVPVLVPLHGRSRSFIETVGRDGSRLVAYRSCPAPSTS